MGRKVSGHKIGMEEIKNGIGNRGLKELICTTYGHELRGGMLENYGGKVEGDKGRKNGKTVIA